MGKALFAPLPHTLEGGGKGKGSAIDGGRLLWFDVIGIPKAAPRGRAVNAGKHARIYIPGTADAWKHDVRAAALIALDGWTLVPPGVAVAAYYAFRLPRPKGHLGTGRNTGKLRPSAPRHHTQVPDKDNLEKSTQDALGKFDGMPPLVWCDDAQVIDGRTSKRWTEPGEEPGASIAIMELI